MAKAPDIPRRSVEEDVEALTEAVEILLGRRGDAKSRALTWQDLIDKDVVRENVQRIKNKSTDTVEDTEIDNSNPPPLKTIPPSPTGFSASGAIETVILTWDNPDSKYRNHSLTEIYRNTTNDLGSATLIGKDPGNAFTDNIGTSGVTRYYWIRFVNTNADPGPYHDSNGNQATTGFVLPSSMEKWLSGNKGDSFPSSPEDGEYFHRTDRNKVYRYDSNADQWIAVDALESPTRIDNAVIGNAAIINAAITTAKIKDGEITNAKIQDATITNAKIIDLKADKITTGNLNVTVDLTSQGILKADDGTYVVRMGKNTANSTDYLLNAFNGTTLKWGVRTTGVMEAQGAIIDGTTTMDGKTGTNIKDDSDRANSGLDSNGDVQRRIGDSLPSSGSYPSDGLYMDADRMGLRKNGSWVHYFDINGDAFFGGPSTTDDNYMIWDDGQGIMIFRGDLDADSINTGTLTGRTVQTASSGSRFEVDSSDNRAKFYNSNGTKEVSLGEVTNTSQGDFLLTLDNAAGSGEGGAFIETGLLAVYAKSDSGNGIIAKVGLSSKNAFEATNQGSGNSTLLGTDTYAADINGDADVSGDFDVQGSKNFRIPHPTKAETDVRHGSYEGPVPGGLIYRFQVTAAGGKGAVDLPEYFNHISKDAQVWFQPVEHFGRAYGKINGNRLHVTSDADGDYEVLVLATRNDADVQNWPGDEIARKARD